MERLAWRGFVRVMRPRTVVPTSGRSVPVDRVMEDVGSLLALDVDGWELRGPATLAMRLEW